jgi:hypothetical protein
LEVTCEGDSHDDAAFPVLNETAAIDEKHIRILFKLNNPLEHLLQVPELLVVRLLLEQAMEVTFKVIPLDVQSIPNVNITEDLFVGAIGVSDQLLRKKLIFQFAQVVTI